jgi:hypothetical protein
MGIISGLVALGFGLAPAIQTESTEERLYGVVMTVGGERLEGFLRWDRNETHWADYLDGRKEIPREHAREAERLDSELRARRERERSISLPGVRITWDEDDISPPESSASAVRFAHLRSLEVIARRRVALTLHSGERVELASSSTDLGPSFRGLIVEGAVGGEVEVEWEDLARVDFAVAPPGRAAPTRARLHGTVATQSGLRLTGYVAWDLDETLPSDVLDGEQNGEDVRLAFADIAAIARESRSSARVTLVSGVEIVLDDSNDVDSGNRGIEITDPTLGRAIVGWDEFVSLEFHPGTALRGTGADLELFEVSDRLRGTVVAEDGRRVSGFVRWDNDEEYGWEVLDGRSEGVDFAIDFARVRQVARSGPDGARVTLDDGRTFLLDGTTDVGEENRGIFVDAGASETVLVRWREFVSATFEEGSR